MTRRQGVPADEVPIMGIAVRSEAQLPAGVSAGRVLALLPAVAALAYPFWLASRAWCVRVALAAAVAALIAAALCGMRVAL